MAKVKAVARKRRAYEYDHHYSLSLGVGRGKRSRGGVSQGGASARPAKPMKIKKAAKKR